MKANLFLIDCLERAANYLETNEGMSSYDYDLTSSCNCGILAQTILDMEGEEFANYIDFPGMYWTTLAEKQFSNCTSTGIPSNKVFAALVKAGLEKEDFYQIEFLEQPVKLLPLENFPNRSYIDGKSDSDSDSYQIEDYEEPNKVAKYFRKRAEELRQQLQNTVPVVEKKVTPITVKESVF